MLELRLVNVQQGNKREIEGKKKPLRLPLRLERDNLYFYQTKIYNLICNFIESQL